MTGSKHDKGKGRASMHEAGSEESSMFTRPNPNKMSAPSESYIGPGVTALAAYLAEKELTRGSTFGLDRELSGLSMTAGKGGSSSRLSRADGLLSEMIPRGGPSSSEKFREDGSQQEGSKYGDGFGMSGSKLSAADNEEQYFLRASKGLWWKEYLDSSTEFLKDRFEVPAPSLAFEAPPEDGAAVCALLSDPIFSPLDDLSSPASLGLDDWYKSPPLSSTSAAGLTPSTVSMVESIRSSKIIPKEHPAQQFLSHLLNSSKTNITKPPSELMSDIMSMTSKNGGDEWGNVDKPRSQEISLPPVLNGIPTITRDEMENWDNVWMNYTDQVWGEALAPLMRFATSRSKDDALSQDKTGEIQKERKGKEAAKGTPAGESLGGQKALERLRMMSGHLK